MLETEHHSHYFMNQSEFEKFSRFVTSECGIKLPPTKKTMLTGRLVKRLRSLGFKSFDAYFDYVSSDSGRAEELHAMIDAVTTNKTDFFREPKHYDYLLESVLPRLIDIGWWDKTSSLRIWSAGCSTGEEPYTLAMILSEYVETHQNIKFSVLGTDISTKVLKKAALGIYDEQKTGPIPIQFKKKYLLRSKDRERGLVRIAPEVRKLVSFKRVNFLDGDYGFEDAMDVIFCRNVIIYFDRQTQERVLGGICSHLKSGGYLFMGHSETLNGLDLPVKQVHTTVYQKVA